MNPYYSPEEMGLKLLITLDEQGLSYEYNTLIVLENEKTGALYWASDSGCSCPTPFEEYTSLDSMNDIRLDDDNSVSSFERSVMEFPVDISEKQEAIGIVRTKVLQNLKK